MKSFTRNVSLVVAFSITLCGAATLADVVNSGFETASTTYTTGAMGWNDYSGAPAGTTASATRSTTDPFAGVAELTLAYNVSASPGGGPAVIAQSDIFATSGGSETLSFQANGVTIGFENNQVQVLWYGTGNSFLGASGFMSFQGTLTSTYSLQSESLTAPAGTTGAAIQFLEAGSAVPLDAGLTRIDDVSLAPAAVAGPATWNVSTPYFGDWNTASSWLGNNVPNGIGQVATFDNTVAHATASITNIPVILGALNFAGSSRVDLTGADQGSLTMQVDPSDPNFNGTAQINVSGGTLDKINLPLSFNSPTAISVATGSTLEIGNPVNLNGQTVTKTGGGTLQLDVNFSASSGTLQASAGALAIGTQAIVSAALLDLAGNSQLLGSGTVQGADLIYESGAASTFAGKIVGAGNTVIVNNSGGRLTLTGHNTYSGGTDVQAGVLVLASSDAILDGTKLTVGANAGTIFGTSVTGGGATVSTAVSPVPEPGTLVLLVAGLVGLGVCRGRRARRIRDWGLGMRDEGLGNLPTAH